MGTSYNTSWIEKPMLYVISRLKKISFKKDILHRLLLITGVIYVFTLFSSLAPSLSLWVILLSFLAQKFILLLPTSMPPSLPLPLLSYFILFIVRASTPNEFFHSRFSFILLSLLSSLWLPLSPPQLRSRSRSRLVFLFLNILILIII